MGGTVTVFVSKNLSAMVGYNAERRYVNLNKTCRPLC